MRVHSGTGVEGGERVVWWQDLDMMVVAAEAFCSPLCGQGWDATLHAGW